MTQKTITQVRIFESLRGVFCDKLRKKCINRVEKIIRFCQNKVIHVLDMGVTKLLSYRRGKMDQNSFGKIGDHFSVLIENSSIVLISGVEV